MFKHCPKKWKDAINIRNGLLFSELAIPKIINIPLHALASDEDYTTELYSLKSIQRIRNCESHHNNKFKLTEETCHQDRARRERE